MKTSNFHLFWIVQFNHRCYYTISCKAAGSAKVKFESYWVIIGVAQTYRIPSDSLFITTLSIIETYPRAWECACIAHLYWNWYDAIGFVTLPLIQSMYVLNCRVIMCLYNRFMNVRPKSPQHLAEQTQSFLWYRLNFSETLTKLWKRFLKGFLTLWTFIHLYSFNPMEWQWRFPEMLIINDAIGTCFDRSINHHCKHQSHWTLAILIEKFRF